MTTNTEGFFDNERVPPRCAYCGRCSGHWSGRSNEAHEPCCEPGPGETLQWRETVREWDIARDARLRSVLWVLGIGVLLTAFTTTWVWLGLALLYTVFSVVDSGPNLTDDQRNAQDDDQAWDELLEAREGSARTAAELVQAKLRLLELEAQLEAREPERRNRC